MEWGEGEAEQERRGARGLGQSRREETDKQGQACSGPRNRSTPARALPFLDPSASSGPAAPAPSACPEGRGQATPSPRLVWGARTGHVPTSWGRQRESRQDQVQEEGRRKVGCPQEPRQKEQGEGKGCAGVGQRDRHGGGTRREGQGGRERKTTSYIHMGEGGQASPSQGGRGLWAHHGSHEYPLTSPLSSSPPRACLWPEGPSTAM